MKFPLMEEIATISVISLSVNETMMHALEMMMEHEHRNLIVIDGFHYRLLNIMDIIKVQNENHNLQLKLSEFDLPLVNTIDKSKNILDALEFINGKAEYICVLNNDESLYGLASLSNIRANIDTDTVMDNYKLQDFFKIGRKLKYASKDEKTSDLINEMITEAYDNIIVAEDEKPIGILTTKDILKMIKNKEDMNLSVSVIMSFPVETMNQNSSIKQAIEFIKSRHYKRVVVVDDQGRFVGVVSQKELISLTYSRLAILTKEHKTEFIQINNISESENKEHEVTASVDAVTGLYNRDKFIEIYLSYYKSMIQKDNQMSLIILDIDFFKKVNDTYGKSIGDKVLIQVSHTILKSLRSVDIVSRWSEDEFVILLPGVGLSQAIGLAERIREYIFLEEIESVGYISASFGVTEVIEGDDINEIIKKAGDALYLAKNCGRNCVKSNRDIERL